MHMREHTLPSQLLNQTDILIENAPSVLPFTGIFRHHLRFILFHVAHCETSLFL